MRQSVVYSPKARADALRYFFGRPGDTIHQIARATGLPSQDLLYRAWGNEPTGHGMSAVRTCDRDLRRDVLAQQHQGDWLFWRDVIRGYWITGPLGRR